jgi:FlaA1/EpsC-like NDP-sugar epimerase
MPSPPSTAVPPQADAPSASRRRASRAFRPRLSWLLARGLRREAQIAIDLGILGSALVLAYLLRFDFELSKKTLQQLLFQLPVVVLVQFGAVLLCGIYSFVWRYVGLREVDAFVRAAVFSMLPLLALRLTLPSAGFLSSYKVPLSVIVATTVLGFGGMLAARVLRRTLFERYEREAKRVGHPARATGGAKRALFLGAGQAGLMAVRELARQPHPDLEVVGFLDDDPEKQGAVIHGIPVLGTCEELETLAVELGIEQLVITMAEVPKEVLRGVVERCERTGLGVQIMPALYELLEGRVNISRFREVRIEDLLGRDPVKLDEEALRAFLGGKRVLVTGAGGSIGSELARQVARFGPRGLLLVERSELALFDVHRDLVRLWPGLVVTPLMADVGDVERMRAILEEYRPEVVVHAAAHKHVPLMEENPCEALKNNALATWRLGALAGELGVERFVLVSTDKAVRPSSVMGASKRLAELFVQELDRRHGTVYVAVRFGNVLGSTGSVIPIFREQIENGGPVTVTHPEMTRYFMTIPEAAQLVLQASAMGEGGEIFVLDMGEPVKIVDLAHDMIHLAGLTPGEDIEVVFTGVRPGEKLFEELGLDQEELEKTRHPKIYIGKLAAYPAARVEAAVARVDELSRRGDGEELREYLAELLPEARLGEEGAGPEEAPPDATRKPARATEGKEGKAALDSGPQPLTARQALGS